MGALRSAGRLTTRVFNPDDFVPAVRGALTVASSWSLAVVHRGLEFTVGPEDLAVTLPAEVRRASEVALRASFSDGGSLCARFDQNGARWSATDGPEDGLAWAAGEALAMRLRARGQRFALHPSFYVGIGLIVGAVTAGVGWSHVGNETALALMGTGELPAISLGMGLCWSVLAVLVLEPLGRQGVLRLRRQWVRSAGRGAGKLLFGVASVAAASVLGALALRWLGLPG